MHGNLLDSDQGNHTESRTGHKWNPIVYHPQQPANGWKNHCRDVIYSETHCHAGSNVSRVCHLLKIGADRYGKIEEDVVQNVEKCQQRFGLYCSVGQKDKNQAEVTPLWKKSPGFAF